MKFADIKMTTCVQSALILIVALFSLQPAWAQNLFSEGNALSTRIYNTDNGPTNSQLTLDFSITQAAILQNILIWGETSGQNGSGVGQSFQAFVLRPLNTTNYLVALATGYLTVSNVGTNTFAISGTPFGLQMGDVIAHYGRGIPFNNGTGGPSSVYITNNLPAPSLGTTITVPGPVYPLYNDGGRNYAIQVLALGQPFLVTTNSDSGPGSLRQAALDSAALGGDSTITFATSLSGQTILLTNGQIELSTNVTIDGSALAKGIQINGNGQSRIFQVDMSATVVINDLIITNASSSFGGGMINYGTLAVNNCTFAGNQASDFSDGGGAIENWNGATLTIINSTFTGNQAHGGSSDGGGAIVDEGGTLTVINSTFIGNQAGTYGGGIRSYGTLNLTNSIVCGNTASSGLNIAATFSITNNLVDTNALLAPLGNYGGPTPTMPPLAGSPAIDGGTNSVTSFLVTDQRGRPRLSGAHVDIGAVEVNPGTIVTTVADNVAGSLRNVIANTTNTDLISFAQNLSGQTITLTSGQVTLSNTIAIDGSALTNGIQINGNGASRVFAMGSNSTATLTALTITNGSASNPTYGGGVINYSSNSILTLNRCTVTGNSSPLEGGGLYNIGSTTINECTFWGNQTGGNGGGGIYNDGTMAIYQSTISGNSSTTTTKGSGVVTFFGSLTMTNTIVAGNSAPSGLQLSYGSFTGAYNLTNGTPLLAPLGNYGGPTQTMPPLAGSPAIDTGTVTSLTTDQRGYPRLSGASVDIGAVEVQIAGAPFSFGGVTRLGNGSIQFGLTNLVGGSFTVFAGTNVALPFNTWSNLGLAVESPVGSGKFQFTDLQARNFLRRFYRVSSP